MSLDAPASRKEKKALRDAERAKQKSEGKKRKRDQTEEQDELQQDFIPLDVGQDVAEKRSSRSHKRKRADAEANEEAPASNGAPQPLARKSKKRKKSQTSKDNGTNDSEVADANTESNNTPDTKSRFIVFIGNLPYTTTEASLHAHFKSLKPFTLRHRTDPKTKKSKGFAFLEFENYDRMKTCLKLYHHSLFDPTKVGAAGEEDATVEAERESGEVNGTKKKGKEKGGARRINVELTAGGGGKAEGRKEKIKAKNVRLDEQRKRRLEEERKAKEKERLQKGDGVEKADATVKKKAGKAHAQPEEKVEAGDTAGMHPSRLARLNKQ